MFRRAAAVVLATAAAVPALTLPASAGGPVSVTGTYRTLVAEGRGSHDVTRDVLVTSKRAYSLSLRGAKPRPGSRVTVTGRVVEGQLSSGQAKPAPAPIPPMNVVPTRTRVLVVLATWTQPDAVTQESATSMLFSDSDGWQREVSYGASGFSGDVTPWVTIAGPTAGLCYTNGPEVMTQARAAAALRGYDLTQYDRTVVYFPRTENPDCSMYAGWAYQPGTEVWVNGMLSRRTVVHELGHAAGLSHAASISCTDATGAPTVISSTCTVNDYGDPSDAMGGSLYVGHFSAVQKNRLGWLPSARVANVAVGGSMTLASIEATSGIAAAYVTTATGRRYWIERRSAVGGDAMLPAGLTNGVLIHVEDPTLNPRPLLLDMTPGGSMVDAALKLGASWTSPEGFTITVGNRVSSGGVDVKVTAPKGHK
jgi:hypothetical protein